MTSDDADPRHYFRLVLQRLLETQLCLQNFRSQMPVLISSQLRTNEHTLSEIKSWLEETGGDWHLVRSPSSVPSAEISGGAWFPPTTTDPGGRPWPSVQAARMEARHGTQQAPSSQASVSTPPGLVRSSTGRLVFLPKSSSGSTGDT